MKELEEAKIKIMEHIINNLKDDLKYGMKAENYWQEVLDKEYLESFAYSEIIKGSYKIKDEVAFSLFVRGLLGFVKEKKYEILYERKHF